MNLKYLTYLFYLIFEGEKTSRELSLAFDVPLYTVSRAMNFLSKLRLVGHPENRRRSWKVDMTKPLNVKLDQLLFISKNNDEFKSLLFEQAVVFVATSFSETRSGKSIAQTVNETGLSRITATVTLNKLAAAGVLTVQGEKPKIYYVNKGLLANLLIETCLEIKNMFRGQETYVESPESIISQIQNNDAVLLLIIYGSYTKKTNDELSDIDLFVVTRDKFDRGEILSKYSRRQIDLNVYSKAGFLQLLKSQPDFISNLAKANVMKGKELLEAVLH